MTCTIYDFETGRDCGQPDLIPGVCYDHCVRCDSCDEPAHPNIGRCSKCLKEDDYDKSIES